MGVFLTISRDILKNTLLAPIREVHCKNVLGRVLGWKDKTSHLVQINTDNNHIQQLVMHFWLVKFDFRRRTISLSVFSQDYWNFMIWCLDSFSEFLEKMGMKIKNFPSKWISLHLWDRVSKKQGRKWGIHTHNLELRHYKYFRVRSK